MLPRRLTTIVALVLVALTGLWTHYVCAQIPGPNADEYAVYTALLREKGYDKEATKLVLEDAARWNDLTQPDQEQVEKMIGPSLLKETVADFAIKNERSAALTNRFQLKAAVVLISRDEVRGIFGDSDLDEAWKVFHARYPKAGSIVNLSRVGFNTKKTQALIYYAYFCGGLCGQGQYILLTKKDDKWVIEKEVMAWIS
ncbi:MAG TPA: hypothetical protein VFZ40_10715 [Pyrinomonadaceae bacterium]